MKKCLGLAVLLISGVVLGLRGEDGPDSDEYRNEPFLILKSTPRYDEALAAAKTASKKLNLKLDLRGLSPNEETGLTYPEKDCYNIVANAIEYPCYEPRGRYDDSDSVSIDDSDFVSIEYSSAYKEFRPKYYIVIGASGQAATQKLATKARKYFPDAYVKTAKVYLGCLN